MGEARPDELLEVGDAVVAEVEARHFLRNRIPRQNASGIGMEVDVVGVHHHSERLEIDARREILVVDVDDPQNAALLEIVSDEILRPRLFFERQRRLNEYEAWVARMKQERSEFLKKYDVDAAIVDAVANDG